jgi:D-alanyl-D-alanine endopeptidase (penicillin-binding protein 7)
MKNRSGTKLKCLIKRLACVFICVLVVVLVSVIEWNNWFRNLSGNKHADSYSGRFSHLQNIQMSSLALRSHELPIKSEAAVVLDTRKGEVLFDKNMDTQLPIASLTKLMTALIFLQNKPDLNDTVIITEADANCVGTSEIQVNEILTLEDLLHVSLMNSSNRATKALVRACGVPSQLFVIRMNRKAGELGLTNTHFREPTGLNEKNKSTALDCAKLLYFTLQDSVISSVLAKDSYRFVSRDSSRTWHRIGSTQKLLFNSLKVRGGKSGYIKASGWCLGTVLEDENGKQIAAVILGAPSKHTRFQEIRSIVQWSMEKHKKGT